jgi:nitrous oxidase accessory protein NosD
MISIRTALIGLGLSVAMTGGAATAGGAISPVERSWHPAAAHVASTIAVHPGQSIQAAVNRAHPGDTVFIMPGRYQQSVLVAKNNLRIRGSGAALDGTVIEPADTPHGVCATESKSGICVFDPRHERTIVGVRVDNLLVRNFEGDGVVGVGTRGLIVNNVMALNNARYGVTRFNSTGGQFINNSATGSGDAGIYIGDSPDAHLFIAGNAVWNNGFGILVRNAQRVSIEYNDVHDNCIGIFLWWLPGVAGDSDIRFNTSRHNNKFCQGADEVGFNYSGSGIALLGAHGVLVDDNSVLNNRGHTPVSGGIVVLSAKSAGGPASTGNSIRRNSAFKNSPADIINRSGWRNSFRGNYCSRSVPDGLCLH